MLVMVGEFRGVRTEVVKRRTGEPVLRQDGSEWVRREASLLVGRDADTVVKVEIAGRDLDGDDWLPEPGDQVAFEVSIETRASERGDRVYRTYKAWRLRPEVVRAFAVSAG